MINFHKQEQIRHLSSLIAKARQGITELNESILKTTDTDSLDVLRQTRNTMIANVGFWSAELKKVQS